MGCQRPDQRIVTDPALTREVEPCDLQIISSPLAAFNLPKTEIRRTEVRLMFSSEAAVQYSP